MLGDSYKNFYQFAFDKPLLAGASFWYYIDEKYKKENVAYFLYLTRIYKSLNSASQRIAKKKFKALLADFMAYEQDKYYKDIRQRRNVPKGTVAVTEDVSNRKDFFASRPIQIAEVSIMLSRSITREYTQSGIMRTTNWQKHY
ncbi:MAG: hypothetical protein WKG06_14110 [Segetibacter sp.]